ncbi:PREDICTED: uncharacterized protein LOC109185292 [Ipomoea nil]|uniref:uncharacterized protein LOC109185292 n=1 Tax=Ipomoea nil TaxID=35883 RepID=UPI000901718D|nr:PREDICTED: uncharacterized protein LOC109185292 [Ipomoea nil]
MIKVGIASDRFTYTYVLKACVVSKSLVSLLHRELIDDGNPVGSPIMLLRNIDHTMGVCNGTRLVVSRLAEHVVEAKIMTGTHVGKKVLIGRTSMTPSNPRFPFKFQRKQFPIMLSYAMTINKSQEQTLTHVGLLLKKPVFVHDQLYVAASRVTNPKSLKIVICDENGQDSNSTINVVYKEIINNL